MNVPPDQAAAAAAAPTDSKPEESRWGLAEGDEIVPGRSALKLLGGGLRYEAYLAWDEHLHSLVVVKVVRPGLVEDARTLAGLAAEAEMLDALNHPVLLRSFGAELEGPRPHLVLEHLEGPRLSSLVRRHGPLPPEQLIPLALQLCAAVHYLGREGYVHLDVKPSNIIMGAPPRLIDLSVALTVERCKRLSSPVGTDSYMAPEQCQPEARGEVGPPADVWGVGATLYRALSGERPWSKGDPDSPEPTERWPQLVERPEPPHDRFPGAIVAPIMACLRFDAAQRPTPAEVAAELEPVLEGLPRPKIARLKPRVR